MCMLSLLSKVVATSRQMVLCHVGAFVVISTSCCLEAACHTLTLTKPSGQGNFNSCYQLLKQNTGRVLVADQ